MDGMVPFFKIHTLEALLQRSPYKAQRSLLLIIFQSFPVVCNASNYFYNFQ